jgi:two-component system, OmpR family, sensor histidine kinase KdpD
MMSNDFKHRPDPDALLSEINRAEDSRGKLKIFLGYAPGVGKTFAMLQEAHTLNKRGVDVVVGYIETHKRAETNALIEGLETLPQKNISYKGISIEEMDVDSIVKRKPQIVLIDELAHTNAPGSRHPKRYLDVKEILDNGIDVLTTVNIQHFESQNDVVAKITGIRVQETIPDSLLDEAAEIKLVDIPLEELFLRLKEGKIYLPEQAQRAVHNFFRKGNLTALREITLRKIASKLDSELLTYMKARGIDDTWPVQDKILVCISPSPYSKQLVRRAFNLANDSGIEWYAIYVSTPKIRNLTQEEQVSLSEAMNLAEKLGAKIFTLSGSDIADEIIHFAKSKNVTRVLLGKPLRSALYEFLKRSPTQKLLHDQSAFDIQLIAPTKEEQSQFHNKSQKKSESGFHFRNYLVPFLILVLLTGMIALLEKIVHVPSFEIIYLIAPITAALLYGMGPAIFVSFLGVLSYDFFFVEPRLTFTINRPEHFISLMIFLAVSLIVSQLIKQSKNQYNALKLRLESLSMMEDLSKELLNIPLHEDILNEFKRPADKFNNAFVLIKTTILEEISKILIRYLVKIVNVDCILFLKGGKNNLMQMAKSSSAVSLDSKELSVASWTLSKNEFAGCGTENLTEVNWVFLPLAISADNIIGVIGLKCNYEILFLEQKNLINTVSRLSSIAMANWL